MTWLARRSIHEPPPPPEGVNWDSPQAEGLVSWWSFYQQGEGRVVREMVRGLDATMDASMDTESWVNTPLNGRAMAFDGTAGDELSVPDADSLSLPATNAAVMCWAVPTWVDGGAFAGKFGAIREWVLWTNTPTNSIDFIRYQSNSTRRAKLTNANFFNGTPTLIVGRTPDTGVAELAIWNAATGLLTDVGETGTFTASGAADMFIGAYAAGSGNGISDLWDLRILHRYPTDDDILQIVDQPWDLIPRPRHKAYFFAPAAGVAVSADHRLSPSWLAGRRADVAIPASWLAALTADYELPASSGATLIADLDLRASYGREVDLDALLPASWLAAADSDHEMPAEWAGAIQVDVSAAIPVEWRASLAADHRLPVESRATMLVDKRIVAEYGRAVETDVPAFVEWLAGLAADQEIEVSWTSVPVTVSDHKIPVEWGGSPFVPGTTQGFAVRPRSAGFGTKARPGSFANPPRRK